MKEPELLEIISEMNAALAVIEQHIRFMTMPLSDLEILKISDALRLNPRVEVDLKKWKEAMTEIKKLVEGNQKLQTDIDKYKNTVDVSFKSIEDIKFK